ncbi:MULTISPECIES: aminotransferase class I/II-fold pyridoxal phosphate-dependent enzyme [unclassified Pseudomonas]|uniref:aminotransferase class I/II-fold pyridoxal phosphate-dependent enzyme n=1 Tax=unclassified Pseudomonas TaxID=196821 RepID=UPI000BD945D5|nr:MULTISPECIES: aminotransferase class I/II-fold pyridoxal phosphate-dependent enzyme [unclassified Pseudomonas]PVZ19778.1 aspartate/methionine/tyrosine aminotransferase [Pseudomonas sp. URIL14HWK12:I12]PVZ26844.1 aspartate/methionine/tyrosine aminotransferase [Pseudomonas sp. URIL14HWK12:I10]PVZ37733.1 aspartate/methionine/tyrosine aminotransferase [Pseudomonas sp. URIL14HWK12:I11]SNZ05886.1 Aspartate/methionine/tyrosine aminotransferase [Pseudomonas sp. URIL14HWK12:I9]
MDLPSSTAMPAAALAAHDITQHEIQALKTRHNLADAHTHQRQSPSQAQIVRNLPLLWERAQHLTQHQSEQAFIQAFFRFHGQHHALKRSDEIYLVYAASVAMHITATYLRKHKLRVGLIEPCFDNLHDLLAHMQVPMAPLPEAILADPTQVYRLLQAHAGEVDAVFLVDPNNPTGSSMFADGHESFVEVARYCRDHGKLLILDFCFAAFLMTSGRTRIDAYALLDAMGTDYLVMEDTGKTWPLQDAKCATLMSSPRLNAEIYSIVTSVLLNVSPFVLQLVTEYINDSAADGFASVRDVLETNRRVARQYLDGTLLSYVEPAVETSVAWFHILKDGLCGDRLQAYLLQHQAYVLPGRYFYWSAPEQGAPYVRLALAREPEAFEAAMKVIRAALEAYDA